MTKKKLRKLLQKDARRRRDQALRPLGAKAMLSRDKKLEMAHAGLHGRRTS
mgnify:CR=1 FL=1